MTEFAHIRCVDGEYVAGPDETVLPPRMAELALRFRGLHGSPCGYPEYDG